MKILRYMYMALAAAAFASCSNDDLKPMSSAKSVGINVTLGADTRVNSENPDRSASSTFVAGDKIRLEADGRQAVYAYDGAQWAHEGSGLIWRPSELNITAFYPYDTDKTQINSVPADQSTVEALRSADKMTYQGIHNEKDGDVTIAMARKMARVVINVKFSKEYGGKNPVLTEFKINNGTTSVSPYSSGNTYVAIVEPCQAAASSLFVTLKVDGNPYLVTGIPTFAAGTSYVYNLNIGLKDVSIQQIYVNPWRDGAEINGDDLELMLHTIIMTKPGTLTEQMVLDVVDETKVLNIEGKVNKADMAVVKAMPEVAKLNLTKVQFVNAQGAVTATLEQGMFLNAVQSEIILPDYIENMGEKCFSNSKITKAKIPAKVTIIPNYCFCLCEKLTSVEFAKDCKVSTICKYTFTDAKILKSINIPSSVTTLKDNAFQGSWFTELVIPETVKNIGEAVFAYTEYTGIETLTIKTKKEGSNVADYIFYGLYDNGTDGDVNLILDDSWFEPDADPKRQAKVLTDGTCTWMGTKFKTLKTVSGKEPPVIELPEVSDGCLNVKVPGTIRPNIVKQALGTKTTLKITGKVNRADMAVVKAVPEVQTLDLSEAEFVDARGYVSATLEEGMFENAEQSEIILPDYIEDMGEKCFVNSKITKAMIPSKATIIPKNCFYICQKLTSVEFAKDCKVTKIEESAFADAKILHSINLPSSLTTLEYQALLASWFTELVIPEFVKNIGASVFYFTECNGLETLTIKTKKEGSNVSDYIFDGLYSDGKGGDVNLILDDSWFEFDANPNRQAKVFSDGTGMWMGTNFKTLKTVSGKEPPVFELPEVSDGCLNVKVPGTIKPDCVKQALGSKTTLKITGKVNKADMAVVKAMREVQTLDLSEAQFVNAQGAFTATLENYMFQNAKQSEIILPDYIAIVR